MHAEAADELMRQLETVGRRSMERLIVQIKSNGGGEVTFLLCDSMEHEHGRLLQGCRDMLFHLNGY